MATFTARGTSFQQSTGNLTLDVPSGTVDGDIMFLAYTRQNANGYTLDASWIPIASKLIVGTYLFHLFYKIANSEPASYSLTSGFGARSVGWIFSAYGGFDSTNPIDSFSNTEYSTADSIVRVASFSVASANSILLTFAIQSTATNPTTCSVATSPNTFTEHYDGGGATGRGWLQISSLKWTSSGATGDIDITSSFATSTNKHGFGVSLNPEVLANKSNFFQFM